MTPEQMVQAAIEVAEEGLAAGELPIGAAMTLGVTEVYYALESPADGASAIAADWQPLSLDLPGYAAPTMTGGIPRHESREQFRRYCRTAPESGFRYWAQTIADLKD